MCCDSSIVIGSRNQLIIYRDIVLHNHIKYIIF